MKLGIIYFKQSFNSLYRRFERDTEVRNLNILFKSSITDIYIFVSVC